MKHINHTDVIRQHMAVLKGLQYETGLFAASSKAVGTGYDKSWIRDNFYECLPFAILGDFETVNKTYRALLDIFLKHEYKIDHAIQKKPEHKHEYIHARFNPENFDEFWEEWGNMQNDSIGAILFMIGLLHSKGFDILQNDNDYRIVQKLVYYLQSLEYWHDYDNGVWEENEEIHASSVGACVAGLQKVGLIPDIFIPDGLIEKGQDMLNHLLPRESDGKFVDLAELSLIYPYQVTTPEQTKQILKNVEYHLVKERGVIRYKSDYYYNKNPDGRSEEAEWCFGFSWLAIIYAQLGNKEKADLYEKKALETVTEEGYVPELYYSNTDEYNENTPLGWSEALLIIAMYKLNKKHVNLKEILGATPDKHVLEHI